MTDETLEKLLYAHTPSENWHLAHPGEPSPRLANVPRVNVGGQECLLFDWKNTLKDGKIAMIKESRFTSVPAHVNRDMELSCVLDGSCDFVVNGRELHLKPGDVLICNENVVRSSPNVKGERDIVVSMVFKTGYFDSVFLSKLPGSSVLTNLLFDLVSRRRELDRYLVVPAAYAGNAQRYIEMLLVEYNFREMCSDELIKSLVTCLFLELIRGLYHRSRDENQAMVSNEKLELVLKHIENEYKTCTLESAAKLSGYNPRYLSSLIKRQTGRTFSEIKTNQQMQEAAYLLANTDRTVTNIARKVGISNMNFFYTKFKAAFGKTPKEYRLSAAEEA